MNRSEFDDQIKRLRTQWPNSYGDERLGRLWITFKNFDAFYFSEIIDIAVDTSRAAPLIEDLLNLEQEVKKRRAWNRTCENPKSAYEQLAAAKKYTPNKEFADYCLKLLRDKLDGKITKEQFFQGCDLLDKVADLQKNSAVCTKCLGTGIITKYDKKDHRFVFRCSCPLGDMQSEKITVWDPNRYEAILN